MVVLRRGIQFSLDHLNQLCSKHVLLPVLLIHGYQYGVIRNIRSHHLLGTYQKTLLVSIRPHRLAHSGDSSTHALHCQVGLASGGSLGRDWRRRPGRPCARWTDQLHNDTRSVPAKLWRQAILRGHGGAMWQPRLATRRRRWRRWQRRRPYLKCVIINVYAFLTVCCVWIWWFYSQRLKSLTLIWAVTSTVTSSYMSSSQHVMNTPGSFSVCSLSATLLSLSSHLMVLWSVFYVDVVPPQLFVVIFLDVFVDIFSETGSIVTKLADRWGE